MAAYLGHYDPPFAHAANDSLWRILRGHALTLGLAAPASLDRERGYADIWRDPALAFAQICVLPLVTSLHGWVRVLAAPIYDFPGCEGANYCSLIVVRETAPYVDLTDLAGARIAINSRDSHSGYTALRHAVAPLAQGERFFGALVETGAHLGSLEAVAAGTVDACACDCITYGLVARHRPAWLAGLRVLAQTETAPAPPYVTCGGASDSTVTAWREALARTIADPQSAAPRAILGLHGIAIPSPATYRRITEMTRVAETVGCD